MKKICLCVLCLCLCVLMTGCSLETPDATVCGQDFYFVSRTEKESWRKPIERLLSNVQTPYGEHGEIMGYEIPRPDEPSVPEWHYCALLDVTMDSVPEILLFPFGGGGSSGNATYYVYDLFSGEQIGCHYGGFGDSWALYYDVVDGELRWVGQYSLRGGWEAQFRFLYVSHWSEEEQSMVHDEILQENYIISSTEIDEDGFHGIVPLPEATVVYKIDGEVVPYEDYYLARDRFFIRNIRIPETSMKVIAHWDLVGLGSDVPDDEVAVLAAEALLSSGQEFIRLDRFAER